MVLVAPKTSHIVLPSLGHATRDSQRKHCIERRRRCRSVHPTSEHSETKHNPSDSNAQHADNSSTAIAALDATKRLAVLKATKSASRPVKQLGKPLGT